MLIHDELVIIRHTLATLRSEIEYLRMTITDLGVDEVDYPLLQCHATLVNAGVDIKRREQKLMEKL